MSSRRGWPFAEHAVRQPLRERPGAPLTEQLEYAFRLSTARRPTDVERDRLAALHARRLAAETGAPTNRQRAAWIAVARVLLNLDETITRE